MQDICETAFSQKQNNLLSHKITHKKNLSCGIKPKKTQRILQSEGLTVLAPENILYQEDGLLTSHTDLWARNLISKCDA